ncbi:hypothetical protein BDZ94DRAFT_1242442, partial [Collybia nuda]
PTHPRQTPKTAEFSFPNIFSSMKTNPSRLPTNSKNAALSTDPKKLNHPKSPEKIVLNSKEELAMIRKQVSDTNELRKSLNDFGITTKNALLRAETAKAKKMAGGSKAVVERAQILDAEVDTMRQDIQAALKDSETYLMSLINGTPLTSPFDFISSRTTLDDIKTRYSKLHDEPSPAVVRGRPGGLNAVHIGKEKSLERQIREVPNASNKRKVKRTKPKGGGGAITTGTGTDKDSDLVTKPGPVKMAFINETKGAAQKIKSKRNRSSGDDDSPLKSKAGHKKAKKYDPTSDHGTTDSELTPAEESSNLGEGDNKINTDPAPS